MASQRYKCQVCCGHKYDSVCGVLHGIGDVRHDRHPIKETLRLDEARFGT